MTFDDYQRQAVRFARYPNQGQNLVYTVLGIAGECGELANKAKKIARDDNGQLTAQRRDELLDELGDVMWYAASIARELDASLADIASANLAKLTGRGARGTIQGAGDKR